MNHRNKYKIISICLILSVVIITIAGFTYSKYKESLSSQKVSLTIASGDLAQSFILQESEAIQNQDGSYSLGTTKKTNNIYYVPSGVTVPKDPHIVVAGKSKVEAYLYVEVVKSNASIVSYALSNNWLSLGTKGGNGGDVYVYTQDGKNPYKVDEEFTNQPVYILSNNEITVGKISEGEQVGLVFYGYMGPVSIGTSASDVYTKLFIEK